MPEETKESVAEKPVTSPVKGKVEETNKQENGETKIEENDKPKAEDGVKTDDKPKDDSAGSKSEEGESKVEKDEKDGEEGGAGTSKEDKEEEEDVPPQVQLEKLIKDGANSLLIKKNPEEAAECLGLACEKARELYGEMGDECAEVFFLYGCSMLECSKILENTVFGEKIHKEEESSDDDEDDKEDEEEEEEQIMLTKKTSMAIRQQEKEKKEAEKMEGEDTTEEKEEEEDNMLRAAWEMFELAKIIYQKQNKEDKVAEIYMKLGEVSVESGNVEAVQDMRNALEIRKRIYPAGDRIIPETHFHIGLAFSFFEKFDEAVAEFTTSKNLLLERIADLEKLETDKAKNEVKEIKDLIPEIEEKISDMIGSKEEKLKAEKAKMNGEGTSASPKKDITNITHLVKRKRKLDEVSTDLQNPPSKKPVPVENDGVANEKSKDESK